MELLLVAAILCLVIAGVWYATRSSETSSVFSRNSALASSTTPPHPVPGDGDSKIAAVRSFLCGVAGESFQNDDGSSRQEIIRFCNVGDPVQLVREPNNRYDRSAIAVISPRGMVGYVKGETAYRLAEEIDSGVAFSAKIGRINGGTQNAPSLGVVLELTRFEEIQRPRFEVELIGERGTNADGSKRQDLIATCHAGDVVTLQANGSGIGVYANGAQIGSIGKSSVERVSQMLNSGQYCRSEIVDISATRQVRIRIYGEFGT